MTHLVALKRLRYPSGPTGKEYNAGDEFTALSERDRKALTLVRAARDATAAAVPAPKTSAPAELPLKGAAEPAVSTPEKRTYKRRDMVAED